MSKTKTYKEAKALKYDNPWVLAWECSRRKCDLDNVVETIKTFLLEPIGSNKYLFAIEFLRSFKADASIDRIIDLTSAVFDEQIVNKIVKDVHPDNILKYYNDKMYLSMDLLTLWEYLIIAGKRRIIEDYSEELINKVWSNINDDYTSIKDIIEALFYGPLSMFPVNALVQLLSNIRRYSCEKECILFKSRILNILIDTYSPKDTLHNPKFINIINQYISDIIGYISSNTNIDHRTLLSTVNELNILLEKLRFHCNELKDYKPCYMLIDSRHQEIHNLFKKIMEITNYLIKE
ncbi:MAG: hypothetical protein DRO40_00500 [Thermoprotei archaeon]|nr:MAG: hypothetical protein DRO40_00500 [Thermoprotei archaeon]